MEWERKWRGCDGRLRWVRKGGGGDGVVSLMTVCVVLKCEEWELEEWLFF